MKTFKNDIMTGTEVKDSKGFALIELLTAIGIIAILIGLLLPAIQRKREAFAAEEATANVQQAANAANHFRNETGEYPQTLAQLVQFVATNPAPGISIDPRLALGKVNGYRYEMVEIAAFPDVCIIEAEPEFPGITGSQTVTASAMMLENVQITSYSTPGADEAREEMFNRIRVKAAETVIKMLKLDGSAGSEIRSFIYEQIEWNFAASLMDSDDDGMISINNIRDYDDPDMDNALKGPLSEFMDYTDDACMWGSLSEAARAGIAVSSGDLELARNDQAPLFSYDGLGVLTKIMVASDGLGASGPWYLCEKLEAAEAAEASGDLRARDSAVRSYTRMVKAEIGRSITRSNANSLLYLLDVVTDETTGTPML